jgi:VWFA-related protein
MNLKPMDSRLAFLIRRIRWMVLALQLTVAAAAQAQQPPIPPAEPPLPMPNSNPDGPVLHLTTKEVLVPTLVEKHDGGVIYGLGTKDFIVEDNGVAQKVHVQEEMDTAPVALVVAIEQGGMSVLEFDKFMKLAPLLDTFLSDDRSQAALVGFDSEPHLVKDFTHSSEELNDGIQHMEPGDGGDAIMDTISYAVDLLRDQPRDYRRVLLLISEARDHSSKHTKTEALIRKIGRSDVLVLTVSFSPARAELLHDLADKDDVRTMNMISGLVMLAQAMKKNVTKEIAAMSGGEYTTFTGDKKFEQRVMDSARHTRNRYLLTFSPTNPTPGLHTLKVRLASDYGARIVARANYWVGDEAASGGAN